MKNKKFFISLLNACRGVADTFVRERNFKIHTLAASCAVVLCVLLRVGIARILVVCAVISFVMCMELVNTAIENIVDMHCGDTFNQYAKSAKDAAAAAVLLAAVLAVLVGLYVFAPPLAELIVNLYEKLFI